MGKVELPARVWNGLVVVGGGDRGLAELAAAQRGLARRGQVLEVGITAGSLRHRVSRGSLFPVLPSVVAVGSPMLQPLGAETAALLYAGHGAVLSHESAAALWGLAAQPSVVALTLIGRRVRGQPGVRVHRVPALDIRDVRMHRGFPVTAPARTLIDCAGRARDVERLLNEARVLGLISDADVVAAIARCPQRAGVSRMRSLLTADQGRGFTRSEAERRLRALVIDARLPPPQYNTTVHGVEVDALWGPAKVVVEVDGYAAHGHREAFERDRARDQRLAAAGYLVIRVTWRQLTREAMAVAVRLALALAGRTPDAG